MSQNLAPTSYALAMPPATTELDPRIERTRRVVRQGALEELAEVGYGAFTIESVASRCGVARSTIYRHWPDKLALIADAFETLNQQPTPHDGPVAQSPRQRIQSLLGHLAEVFQDSIFSACVPSLIDGAERHREVRRFHHRYSDRRRQTLVDAIAEAVAAGEVARHVDPDLAAVALAGAIMYPRLMTAGRFDPDRVTELVDMVLGAPPKSPRGRRPDSAARRTRSKP
jgi:TetR/AcrR family transcriptional regulator of autoinduction and epiphytic fitness